MSERVNGFDLGALDTRRGGEQGCELQLKHPASGALLPCWVRVRGYDADSYQKKLQEQQASRLERLPGHKPSVQEINEQSLELAATLVAGWRGVSLDGEPLEYTEAAAVKLLKRFPWIREQVEVAAADRGNFLPGSASSS